MNVSSGTVPDDTMRPPSPNSNDENPGPERVQA